MTTIIIIALIIFSYLMYRKAKRATQPATPPQKKTYDITGGFTNSSRQVPIETATDPIEPIKNQTENKPNLKKLDDNLKQIEDSTKTFTEALKGLFSLFVLGLFVYIGFTIFGPESESEKIARIEAEKIEAARPKSDEELAHIAFSKSDCFSKLRSIAREIATIEVDYKSFLSPEPNGYIRHSSRNVDNYNFFGKDILFKNAFGIFIPTEWVCKESNGKAYSISIENTEVWNLKNSQK